MHPGVKSKHNEAAAIVADMTRAEKARFCSGKNFWHLEASDRHDLPPIMVTDGPHGLRKQDRAADHLGLNKSVPATCFPTASALASSWNPKLIGAVGDAIGKECVSENVAVLLGPGLNIKRHPCCGRNFEYFSEDPLLSGELAQAFVNGVQANGVGTSVKHYAVNNQEEARMVLDAVVDPQTLREIYLRGFEIAVKRSQPWTVMCAYNRVNGTYCSEHNDLLNTILRDEWGFEGLVVTDWGAANDRASSIGSGLDLEMPGNGGINDALVLAALEAGTLNEQDLDQAITRNVSLSLLGGDLQVQPVSLEANHSFAREVAAECTVLLKNTDHLLPLSPPEGNKKRIAVIGAFSKHPRYQGAGSSQVNPTQLECAWDCLSEALPDLTYSAGYDPRHSEPDEALINEAVIAAQTAEVVIIFAGLPSIYESEGFDRTHINLPAQHDHLIEAVCDVNENVVVVLSNGAPVAMPWVAKPKAIIEGYLAGQAGGGAIVDVLLGIKNPSGKLAESFPLAVDNVPSQKWFPGEPRQVQYREGLMVGYRYFASAKVATLFPFGHGLSYSTFDYADLAIDENEGSLPTVQLSVTNLSDRAGADTIQLYVSPPTDSPRPSLELRGFTKVFLAPGETRQVAITLDEHCFSEYAPTEESWQSIGGEYGIHVGASSEDLRLHAAFNVKGSHQSQSIAHNFSTWDVDDEKFEAMLGTPIPPAEGSRPFHINSAIKDLQVSWLGRRVRERIIAEFTKSMGSSDNETLKKMFTEMADSMPLRGMVLFSRGARTFAQVEVLIALLNHRYIRALRLSLFG
ncbi:MAG: beta-glucosidase [Limisphaerales bacterium]|jgi:beta-glucosidase